MDKFELYLKSRIEKNWELWNGHLHPSQRTGNPSIIADIDYLETILNKYRELMKEDDAKEEDTK